MHCEASGFGWEIAVESGPTAGQRWWLQPGECLTIGRALIDDTTVSAAHLAVGETWSDQPGGQVPSIRNLSGTNPASIDGQPLPTDPTAIITSATLFATPVCRIRLGSTMIRLTAIDQSTRNLLNHARNTVGSTTVNRPPATDPRRAVVPISVPPVSTTRPAIKLNFVTLLIPIVMGAVLAILINPMLAIMAASSPIMMLGTWLEDKRRARRDKALGHHTTTELLDRFEQQIHRNIDTFTDELLSRNPSPADLDHIATAGGLRLWERRLDHVDVGVLVVGLGEVPAPHQLDAPVGGPAHAIAEEILAHHQSLHEAPVTVSLAPGRIVGVVGSAHDTVALIRSLVTQACVLHGPADLRIAVCTNDPKTSSWDWSASLPHAGIDCEPLMSNSLATIRSIADDLERTSTWTILVVDDMHALQHPCFKSWLADFPAWLTLLIVAERINQVPQRAESVICCEKTTSEIARYGSRRESPAQKFITTGISLAQAERIANTLSSYEDGALGDDSMALPDKLRLSSLLPTHDLSQVWGRNPHKLVATIGVAGSDPVTIDLVADGPHALIAGTTGSGKSEFLRTLVCALSASHGPEEVNFVLIDYKGGAAFAGLDQLPHTVGFVTDLDAGLGARALTCLEAELQYRERLLHAAGVDDIIRYTPEKCVTNGANKGRTGEVLPRLVVIIDEFATMIKELPDFVSALIGIAQRGRSLGVHLVLATQRPAGAVNDSIRANTNLRLSLRVQAVADSVDVLGSPKAATLDRRFPGRAVLRLGPDEFVSIQTASCTLPQQVDHQTTALKRTFRAPASALPIGQTSLTAPSIPGIPASDDLSRIVAEARKLSEELGLAPGRRPWPEPLPVAISFEAEDPIFGIVDRPMAQRVEPLIAFDATTNVLLIGAGGSGHTKSLATIATCLAATHAPSMLHLYLVDHGPAATEPLAQLPHVGARITAAEPDRLDRLARILSDTIENRRAMTDQLSQEPQIVVCIDDWASMRSAIDDLTGTSLDRWHRIFADGPALGIFSIITIDRAQAMSSSATAAFGKRFAFQLNDPLDDAILGIPRSAPLRRNPGRALDLGDLSEVQFGLISDATISVQAVIKKWAHVAVGFGASIVSIASLPEFVSAQTIIPGGIQNDGYDDGSLCVSLGIGDANLSPIGWKLLPGEHGLVTGPSASGKTNALAVVAGACHTAQPSIEISVVCGRRKTLIETMGAAGIPHHPHDDLASLIQSIDERHAERFDMGHGSVNNLVLIDDADLIDDATGAFAKFIAARPAGVWIVASGRADTLRSSYGHWTVPLRRSRKGLCLRPHLELDGELWATTLPRRAVRGGTRSMPVGRGFLIDDGHTELLQVGCFSPIESGSDWSITRRMAS
jgi:DNA segregation ATPase FtsK/SpoIIIE, S-DNA-T family